MKTISEIGGHTNFKCPCQSQTKHWNNTTFVPLNCLINISKHIKAVFTETGSEKFRMILLHSPELITFSSSNIGEFSKDVKMLAALQEEDNDGDKLLDAARRLAGAFSDLMNAAQPDSQEVSWWKVKCGDLLVHCLFPVNGRPECHQRDYNVMFLWCVRHTWLIILYMHHPVLMCWHVQMGKIGLLSQLTFEKRVIWG